MRALEKMREFKKRQNNSVRDIEKNIRFNKDCHL